MYAASIAPMGFMPFAVVGVPWVCVPLSVSYVDHNILQVDLKNADSRQYIRTACAKFGAIFSPPDTGICHQLHVENFAKPGAIITGTDSHTPTSGGGALWSWAKAACPPPRSWPAGGACPISMLTVRGGVGKALEYGGRGEKFLK